jgi:hypothetical protein
MVRVVVKMCIFEQSEGREVKTVLPNRSLLEAALSISSGAR